MKDPQEAAAYLSAAIEEGDACVMRPKPTEEMTAFQDDDLKVTDTETSIEINFAVLN